MRKAGFLTVLILLVTFSAASAAAQKTRKPRPKPAPTPVKPIATAEVAAAKQKVANQLHNVNVFVDIMGPVAVGIEANDKDAAARRLKPADIEKNDLNKRKLIAAIRNLRDGLVALETDFRTKPGLAAYLPKIQGIGTLCSQSEDSAIAGRFVAAKDPLRQVAAKLNDTLAVLPGPAVRTSSPVAAQPTPAPPRTIPVSNQSTTTASVQNASIIKREPAMGMTTAEVLQTTWGTPANKRSTTSPNGTTEVWTYAGTKTIYFYKGKVTRIVR